VAGMTLAIARLLGSALLTQYRRQRAETCSAAERLSARLFGPPPSGRCPITPPPSLRSRGPCPPRGDGGVGHRRTLTALQGLPGIVGVLKQTL
jgi:hypothetical protein